jgi:hypothetical protein
MPGKRPWQHSSYSQRAYLEPTRISPTQFHVTELPYRESNYVALLLSFGLPKWELPGVSWLRYS